MLADAPAVPPPFLTVVPPSAPSPVVISVGHAGRYYPPALAEQRAVGWDVLRELEDRYADRLITDAVAGGATAVVATHARAWIDLNRAAGDFDASSHARSGLGIVPQRLGGRSLWRRPITEMEIAAREAACHRPYHDAIASALRSALTIHGHALLIDCHSMPPILTGPNRGTRVVIGDRYGATASSAIASAIAAAARDSGVQTARNAPYAGAHTIAFHADPVLGVHALQIETDRSLYLDNALRDPGENVHAAARLFARLCDAGLRAMENDARRWAAE